MHSKELGSRNGSQVGGGSALTRREFMGRTAIAAATATTVLSTSRSPNSISAAAKEDIVQPIQFAHIATRGNLPQQVEWYKTVLGNRIFLNAGFGAWGSYDDEHHRVSFFGRGDVPAQPDGVGGFDHMAFGYNSLDDLILTYRRLKFSGIEPQRCATYGPTTSMYYVDPSGLAVELLVDGFESNEDLHAYTADGALFQGASGTDFDPETLVSKGAADPETLITPSEVSHTVIRARRYDRMIDFYQSLLGCDVQHRSDRAAFLTYGDASHRIVLVKTPGVEQPGTRFGYDHFAHEYANMQDLVVNTYARVKEAGLKPFWCTNHGMTTSIYYADPDGNRVETQVDNFKTKAEGLEYIQGADFKRNPIGIDFDPDEMADKVRGGAAYEEIHFRIEGPRTNPVPNPVAGEHY